MKQLNRIGAYVWPYRRRLILSVFCALMVSVLWSMNLSITLPVVRLLFDSDSLHASVDKDIASRKQEIEDYSTKLEALDEEQLSQTARIQRKLNEASQSLLINQWIKDTVLPWVPREKFRTIVVILMVVVLATILKGLFSYSQELLVGSFVHSAANDIRANAFDSAMRLDYQSLDGLGTATLTSRLTNDVTELGTGLRMVAVQLVREPFKAGCCILVALILNWRLTLGGMVVLPMIGVVFYRSSRILRNTARHMMETMSSIYQSLEETFNSTRVVLAFNGQPHHAQRLRDANQQYYAQSMNLIRISALIRPVTELLGIVAFMLVLIPGAYMVLNRTDSIVGIRLASGVLGIDELTTLYVLLAGVLDPVRKLSGVFPQFKRSLAASDRIFEVIDQQTRVPETLTPVMQPSHCREIVFENVSFRYRDSGAEPTDSPLTLQKVSLCIPYGQVVAVVGGNGSGKSTLLSLLPRLIDPLRGSVRIDGTDIRDLSLADLRQQIGVVTQDTILFDESIADNVRYSSPEASAGEVENAILQAHANDFVSLLPQGLNTKVGMRGQKLSGGQKQRIALARAILKSPAILVLDEATSAIDAESEVLIYSVLKKFSQGRTVFIVTHVINSTFLDLIDRVLVLDKGQVLADGTHEELLHCCPEYTRLVQPNSQPRQAA